jgi:peroxiredoxin
MNRTTLRNIVVIAVTTLVILGGLAIVKNPWAATNNTGVTTIDATSTSKTPVVGDPAPTFTTETIDGDLVSLADLKGTPVWLVFGATWCSNCRAEAPDVEKVARDFDGRATVLSIYVGETPDTVRGYATRIGLSTPQIADEANVLASSYGVMGVPAHYFVDSQGVLQKIVVGTISAQAATDILDTLTH